MGSRSGQVGPRAGVRRFWEGARGGPGAGATARAAPGCDPRRGGAPAGWWARLPCRARSRPPPAPPSPCPGRRARAGPSRCRGGGRGIGRRGLLRVFGRAARRRGGAWWARSSRGGASPTRSQCSFFPWGSAATTRRPTPAAPRPTSVRPRQVTVTTPRSVSNHTESQRRAISSTRAFGVSGGGRGTPAGGGREPRLEVGVPRVEVVEHERRPRAEEIDLLVSGGDVEEGEVEARGDGAERGRVGAGIAGDAVGPESGGLVEQAAPRAPGGGHGAEARRRLAALGRLEVGACGHRHHGGREHVDADGVVGAHGRALVAQRHAQEGRRGAGLEALVGAHGPAAVAGDAHGLHQIADGEARGERRHRVAPGA